MRADRRRRRGGNDGSFWLSFSDLMSSLVLIIILVMFYIIYQYFNEAETNARIIAAREAELTAAQAELSAAQDELATAQSELATQQQLVATRETELAAAQTELDTATRALGEREAQLTAQQAQLDTLSAQLDDKQTEIDTQQAQLDAQQLQLNSQQAQLDAQQAQLEMQQEQIEQLVGLRTRIVTAVSEAFRANSINATVDPANGSIALESDVLFSSGDAGITESGKRFLDGILPIYLSVLFSSEYRPYVTEIIIEGHTDSDGTWLSNMELSQQRAYAVISYVMSDECRTVTADMKNELREIVTVNGRSYSERVFSANGTEDKDASRRVVFKFRLTDEQMITQLQSILETKG